MDLFTLANKQNDQYLLEEIFRAYKDARKNKRNKRASLEFEYNHESELIDLYHKIIARKYIPKPSIAFLVTKPVIREVFAADFKDRVVHHLIFNHINHIFESEFITDSYSCRKNKGTLYGINKIAEFISNSTKRYKEDSYILKLDVQGYFYSIDKALLYDIVKTTLSKHKSKLILDFDTIDYLIHTTIFSDSTKNVKKIADPHWEILPKNKSLFFAKKGCGLPIGNLTSQLFSNIYMNIFDQYIVNELQIKYYGRYVDDFIVIHNDKKYLLSLIEKIKLFLKQKLNLTLHPKKIYIQHYSKGVQFLGGYIKPKRKYISKRTKGNFNNLIRKINLEFLTYKDDIEYLYKLRAQINSYLGIMKHFKTYKLRIKSLSRLKEPFFRYFKVDENCLKVVLKVSKNGTLLPS